MLCVCVSACFSRLIYRRLHKIPHAPLPPRTDVQSSITRPLNRVAAPEERPALEPPRRELTKHAWWTSLLMLAPSSLLSAYDNRKSLQRPPFAISRGLQVVPYVCRNTFAVIWTPSQKIAETKALKSDLLRNQEIRYPLASICLAGRWFAYRPAATM